MIGTSSIANLIREAKIFQIPSIMQTSKKQGMCLMNDSFLDLVKKKIVDPQEAYAKAVDKLGLVGSFKSNNIDTSWLARETSPVPAWSAGCLVRDAGRGSGEEAPRVGDESRAKH